MKKRIRAILLLMIVCILGINLFQGYWLYNSYRVNYRQFTKDINEALFHAVQGRQLLDVKKWIGERGAFRYRESGGGQDSVFAQPSFLPKRVFIVKGLSGRDSMVNAAITNYPGALRMKYLRLNERKHYADTLARQLSDIIVMNDVYEKEFSLKRLDSSYRAELRFRDVDAPFVLDTLHASFPPFLRSNQSKALRKAYPLFTKAIPVNPLSSILVQASFKNPIPFILKKMIWLLIGSFLLLALTTGCFVYMLSTILRQKKLSEVKNDFINNMTHELKTPIAIVSAAVEAMQNFDALADKKKTAEYLSISKSQVQRLSDLVEKVLNIAAEEKEDIELFKEKVHLPDLIDHIISHQRVKAPKPVNFVAGYQMSDPYVAVDKIHFTNTINNLIDNSVKYSKEQVNIDIRCEQKNEEVVLRIRDDGIGIPKIYQESVFEKFFRVPTGNLHNVKGFGLGLSYVRKIVEKHGGSILLQSEMGAGSEFIIVIPNY